MFKRIFLLFWLAAVNLLTYAQITTNPAIPVNTQAVTITFDSSKDSRLGYFTSDLYAHTGVILSNSTDWQHVIGSWGNNTTQPKLTNKGNGIYELVITPDINTYYSVSASELVTQMAFVFRSADGSKQTKDLFVNVSTADLHVSISSPSRINVFDKSQAFSFTAASTLSSDLKLFLNNQQIVAQSGLSVSQNMSIPNAGNYWLKATASQNNVTVRDSVYVCVREAVTTETMPAGLPAGINYIDDKTVTLVLYAPLKNNVFVVGDFNNWLPDNTYQMKKDGDYFWLTIGNLTPQKEYIFQYLIDGTLKVADPYTDKISDPDDQYISSDVYPNLSTYPQGKASDRASILQTAQTPYTWTTTTYNIPQASKLSIYELLIRDFTTEKTYKAVQEKIGYLKQLGINAIELMPFSEFEGNSSWGYNPNFFFAPDKAYGTKNDLKNLIDECHKQGLVVIQDIVLNHAYNSCPLVKMYWDDALGQPSADNPWFNQVSPNPDYSYGNDFNHEKQATKDFVDRVTKYWLTEYKVDGFRFDFVKGFTNTPGEGTAYDASRIAILERIADKIWSVNSKAFVILESFTANQEEKELASYGNGMLVWGKANEPFSQAAIGSNDNGSSNFSTASYQYRGYTKPGLIAYMESHDEERQMYLTITGGKSLGSYDTKVLATALKRSQLATTFFLSLAGPKMIWQFGEMGYDISINQGGRLSEKPVLWNYLDNADRKQLFNVYAAMLRLRKQFDVFTSGQETLSLNSEVKEIQLTLGDHNITLVGNFGLSLNTVTPNFQHTGTWYEFFSGEQLQVTDVSAAMLISAGEFKLYSDKPLPSFNELATVTTPKVPDSKILVFPNPVGDQLNINAAEPIQKVQLFSVNGRLIRTLTSNSDALVLPVSDLSSGIYLVRIQTENQVRTQKISKF